MKKTKLLAKLHNSKSGRFVDYFRTITIPNVIFLLILSLVVTFFINFLLNQFFGTRILPLGQPVRFMLILFSIVPVFYVIIRKQGVLERQDIFTIGLITLGSFALFYYLPVLMPEIFTNPSNAALSMLNNAYTDPNNPVAIWYNNSVVVHNLIQSVIPIP